MQTGLTNDLFQSALTLFLDNFELFLERLRRLLRCVERGQDSVRARIRASVGCGRDV